MNGARLPARTLRVDQALGAGHAQLQTGSVRAFWVNLAKGLQSGAIRLART